MPNSYSSQTLKLVSISLACCLSCSSGISRVKASETACSLCTRLCACAGSPGLKLVRNHLLPAASWVELWVFLHQRALPALS